LEAFVFALKTLDILLCFNVTTVLLLLVSYTVGTLRNLNVTHKTSLPQPETYRYSRLADLRSFRIPPFCPESSHWACYSIASTLLPATPLSDAAI
jgi:hypothetical protein